MWRAPLITRLAQAACRPSPPAILIDHLDERQWPLWLFRSADRRIPAVQRTCPSSPAVAISSATSARLATTMSTRRDDGGRGVTSGCLGRCGGAPGRAVDHHFLPRSIERRHYLAAPCRRCWIRRPVSLPFASGQRAELPSPTRWRRRFLAS